MMGLEDGFGVLDKAAEQGSSSSEAGDLGGEKKLQSSKSLQQMIMMMGHHRDNLHRPFLDCPHEFGSEPSGSGDGPTTCTTTTSRPKISNIYDVVVATSGSSAASSATVGATTFDISATNSEISHVTAFKSPGGMAASLEFPFTSSQRKELQRQALIFQYMMACLPVPPDLLFPTIRNPSVAAASHCRLDSGLNLGFSGRGRGDLEPGRCRRTDGKKWRCSRDVAPGQKYCERHMHRGRPRSRKPVELLNKKPRQSHTQDLPSSPSTLVLPNSCIANASPSPFLGNFSQPFHQNQTTEFPGELSQKSATFGSMASVASYKEPSLDWIIDRESVSMAPSHQQLQHLIDQTKIELPNNSPLLNQNCSQEPLNLNSYVDFGKDQEINNCHLILNPDMAPMGRKPHGDPGRSFIDAWSSDGHSANPVTKTDEKLSLSPLSLSTGGSSIINDEMGHIHMGLGVTDSDQNQESGAKPHLSSWLLAPAPWTAPTPGGPLAEVLRTSKVAHATTNTTETSPNPLSPIAKNDDPCSPSVNAMSSPSGVLHRTLASMSDSSGSGSPTFPNSRAKREISFLWLSQGKSASSN